MREKDITKKVAKLRFEFHSSMLDVINVANQLHILSDNKAEMKAKYHCMECFDALERLGYPVSDKLNGKEEEK